MSFLFAPKVDLELQADSSASPGTQLPVEMRLRSRENFNPRQIRVELVGKETYYVQRTHTDSKGNTHTTIEKRVDDFEKAVYVVAEKPALTSGMEQKWEIKAILPPDAAPSAKGAVVHIRWELRAVVDTAQRRDVVREEPLILISPPPTDTREMTLSDRGGGMWETARSSFEECTMTLDISRTTVSPGDTITGRLRLETSAKLELRGVRAELVCLEDAQAKKSDKTLSRQDISGSVALSPHEYRDFPFMLTLPAEAPPTTRSPHSSLNWEVRLILDRPMRTDFRVKSGVFVFHRPAAAKESF